MNDRLEEFFLIAHAKVVLKCPVCHKFVNYNEGQIYITKNGVYHSSCYVEKFPDEYEKRMTEEIKADYGLEK